MQRNWPEAARRVLRRIETQIRCLIGTLAFIEIDEETEIEIMPYVESHLASSHNANVGYSKKLDRVIIMGKEPRFVALVGPDEKIEIVKEYSEAPLYVVNKRRA